MYVATREIEKGMFDDNSNSGGGSVMVWGAFMVLDYCTELKVSWMRVWWVHASFFILFCAFVIPQHVSWCDSSFLNVLDIDILKQILKPSAQKMKLKKFVFEHDRDPKHTARLTQQWLRDNKIDVLDWIGQSPDLSPIENLWTALERRVNRRHPKNKQDLWYVLQQEWNAIDLSVTRRLASSLPKRLDCVVKQRGGQIDYWSLFVITAHRFMDLTFFPTFDHIVEMDSFEKSSW